MEELEVFIQFSAITSQSNKSSYWCDSIELFIVYGTYLEFIRGKHTTSRHKLTRPEVFYK